MERAEVSGVSETRCGKSRDGAASPGPALKRGQGRDRTFLHHSLGFYNSYVFVTTCLWYLTTIFLVGSWYKHITHLHSFPLAPASSALHLLVYFPFATDLAPYFLVSIF